MKNQFSELRDLILEADSKKDSLILEKLNYGFNDLDPVISKENLNFHYSVLAKGYVDRFNNNEGDPAFNKAGAFLHNIFFSQLTLPKSSNKPFGNILEFINKHFNSFDEFKESFAKEAMKIQGSGWIYLSSSGKLKVIENHEIRQDIILLIDWWEHAWYTDYGPEKKKYLTNIWRIINWNVINDRINLKN